MKACVARKLDFMDWHDVGPGLPRGCRGEAEDAMTRWFTRSIRAGAAALVSTGAALVLVSCGSIPAPGVGNQAPGPDVSSSRAAEETADRPAEEVPEAGTDTAEPTPPAPPPAPVRFASTVTDATGRGKSDVKVSTMVRVTASKGTLRSVSLTYRGVTRAGKKVNGTVAGSLNAAMTTWVAKERLEPSSTYNLTTSGTGAAGPRTQRSAFRTERLSADQETFASISPQTDGPVGMGMPIVVTFDVPVKDRATFQRNLHVQSSPAQEGAWSWLSDTQVRYRPKTWWRPGTKVKAWADINGLPAGNGVYGQRNVSTEFTVSNTTLLTRVDLRKKQAKVYINSKLARTIAISAGKSGWETRSGTKLIMGKRPLVRMTGVSIGIKKGSSEDFSLNVRYAMQITASGEYLHAAPWNASRFGRSNSSHGCVGMSTSNAIWLYNRVRAGDPVITTGSDKELYQGNGYAEWNISYAQFKKGSAL